MRTLLLASASLLLVGGTALAQNSSSPMSSTATHTSSVNTKSAIAPRLPISTSDTSADQYLVHAQSALKSGHTGAAQEALERAETRLLSRSTMASQASMPSSNPKLTAVEAARQALGKRDRAGAMQSIQTALSTPDISPTADTGMTGMMPAAVTSTAPANPYVSTPTSPNVPPNSLGGIGSSTGTDGGTGVGSRSRPQAAFSGPSNSSTVVPSPSGNALGGAGQAGSTPAVITPAQ